MKVNGKFPLFNIKITDTSSLPFLVYIAGALNNVTEEKQKILFPLYEAVALCCLEEGVTPILPATFEYITEYGESINPYLSCKGALRRADFVFVFLGEPALGVGGELEIGKFNDMLMIGLKQAGSSVTEVVEEDNGNSSHCQKILEYKDKEDLVEKVRNCLMSYKLDYKPFTFANIEAK